MLLPLDMGAGAYELRTPLQRTAVVRDGCIDGWVE